MYLGGYNRSITWNGCDLIYLSIYLFPNCWVLMLRHSMLSWIDIYYFQYTGDRLQHMTLCTFDWTYI